MKADEQASNQGEGEGHLIFGYVDRQIDDQPDDSGVQDQLDWEIGAAQQDPETMQIRHVLGKRILAIESGAIRLRPVKPGDGEAQNREQGAAGESSVNDSPASLQQGDERNKQNEVN